MTIDEAVNKLLDIAPISPSVLVPVVVDLTDAKPRDVRHYLWTEISHNRLTLDRDLKLKRLRAGLVQR